MSAFLPDDKRYQATIYISILLTDSGNDEADLAKAKHIAKEFASLRPNSEVGQVIEWGRLKEEAFNGKDRLG